MDKTIDKSLKPWKGRAKNPGHFRKNSTTRMRRGEVPMFQAKELDLKRIEEDKFLLATVFGDNSKHLTSLEIHNYIFEAEKIKADQKNWINDHIASCTRCSKEIAITAERKQFYLTQSCIE